MWHNISLIPKDLGTKLCQKLAFSNKLAYTPSGLYYKRMTIVIDDSRIIGKWSSKLFDDALVVIYNRNVFII